MPFTRTVLALSLGLVLLQLHHAAPPLSMSNGNTILTTQISNAWIEINKAAFEHNIRTLQAELDGKSKLCAVLKADAYGHGIGLLDALGDCAGRALRGDRQQRRGARGAREWLQGSVDPGPSGGFERDRQCLAVQRRRAGQPRPRSPSS